ncbi:MAG: transcriptional regulator NrdR [Phycisphaerales bacterium JB043]
MICPYCGSDHDKVIDSRASEGGRAIRRRRACTSCKKRYTTYERVEETSRLTVVKRDGTRVPFSGENILRGVQSACGKRPVPDEIKRKIVEQVEESINREFDREVDSRVIGERVASYLREVDKIAFIRFASEYYNFETVGEFMEGLEELELEIPDTKEQGKLFEGGSP